MMVSYTRCRWFPDTMGQPLFLFPWTTMHFYFLNRRGENYTCPSVKLKISSKSWPSGHWCKNPVLVLLLNLCCICVVAGDFCSNVQCSLLLFMTTPLLNRKTSCPVKTSQIFSIGSDTSTDSNYSAHALHVHDDAIDEKSRFIAVYDVLKSEILYDPDIHYSGDSRKWVEKMLDYNVPNGKLNRGLSVIDSYKILKGGGKITENEFFLASTLGWCIEWLQACCLVLDDIMDNSHTRRGQPSWFRLPNVGSNAIFDGVLIHNHIKRIIKRHFPTKRFYIDLLDLFNEVCFQTACGQMLDLITTDENAYPAKYTWPTYARIVKYKTAYYSFYLPVACALLLAGENLDDHVAVKNILMDMGIYFQTQDDYLDCFADPEVLGKIGTDIEDFRCSWLAVQAIERANKTQLQRLLDNYGKDDPSCVSHVKALYKELRLQEAFIEYEEQSYQKLISAIETRDSEPVKLVLKSFLKKIYKRKK